MSHRPALLLVDVQRDFLARSGLEPDATALVAAIARLLDAMRARNWPVFHIHTRVAADGSDWMPHWRRAGRGECIAGTSGAEPPEALRPRSGETVLTKRFFDAFDNEALVPALRAASVGTVIVAGIHTHACVREAAVSAYSRGFDVFVPTDAIGSYDPAHARLTLGWLHGRAAQCLPTGDILALLSQEARETAR